MTDTRLTSSLVKRHR